MTYGDLCIAEIWDGGVKQLVSCSFIETNSNGDSFYRIIDEDFSIRGDDYFADYYVEVGDVRFVSKPDNPELFIGAGI